MRKPEESLDDFTVKAVNKPWKPFVHAPLGPTGAVRVLKPVVPRPNPVIRQRELPVPDAKPGIPDMQPPVRPEVLVADPDPAIAIPFLRPAGNRLSWLQSSLAAAGVIVLFFLSALFVANLDPLAGPEVAGNLPAADVLTGVQEPLDLQDLIAGSYPPLAIELLPIRSPAKRVHARRVHRAAHRPRVETNTSKPAVAAFVPTKLVIYAENGEIKSRIEPQFVSVHISH